MSVESIILNNFAPSWKDSRVQAIPEIASCLQEANHKIDDYCFFEDEDGDLFSPTAKCKITSEKAVKRHTEVGRLEGQAVDSINDWFKKNKQGIMAWISPKDPLYYKEPKIIISEIVSSQGRKGLFNRAILLESGQQDILKTAQIIAEHSLNRPLLQSISQVRSTPLFLNKDSWMSLLGEVILDPEVLGKIRSGEDLLEQSVALQTANEVYDWFFSGKREHLDRAGKYFGDGNLSCPVRMAGLTPFEVFLGHSLALERCKKIKCGKEGCSWEASNEEVKRIQKRELTCCPKCGWKPS